VTFPHDGNAAKANMYKINFSIIQLLLWILAYVAIFLYCFYKFNNLSLTIVYSVLVTLIYLATTYGNSHVLIPRFFDKRKIAYVIYSIGFLVIVIALRMQLEHWILFRWMNYKWFFNFSHEHYSFSSVTIIFAFLFGALLRISMNHFALLQQMQERQSQQVTAELNLLKSQVQPHFLFNALNNIYYLSYVKSDLAPQSIARLSDIMRYFVEEAPKGLVPLKAELDFIQDYIEVERIRLAHNLHISWNRNGKHDEQLLIPPILLIPLVENVFKHGVDKTKEHNEILLSVDIASDNLNFVVKNSVYAEPTTSKGTGLNNLRKRLHLLYDSRFELITRREANFYIAQLTIPLT
jgi:sensor histidine kinase YesM